MCESGELTKEILRMKMLKIGKQSLKDEIRNKIVGKYKEEIERWTLICKDMKEEEKNNDLEKIGNSRYCAELVNHLRNDWESDERPQYIEEKKDIGIMARYRLGNENFACKYWWKDRDKECRLCKKAEETLSHIFTECPDSRCKKIYMKY